MQADTSFSLSRTKSQLTAALWALVFTLVLGTTSRTAIWGDAGLTCLAAGSLLQHGKPDLPEKTRFDVMQGQDGRYYSKYPLLSVLSCVPAAPFLEYGRQQYSAQGIKALLIGLLPAAMTATVAAVFFLLALAMGAGLRTAVWTTLLLIFSTPLWNYGRSFYSEITQAAVYIWAIYALIMADSRQSRRWLIVAGLLLGMAPNAKATLIVLWPIALVYLLWRRGGLPAMRRAWIYLLLGMAPGIAAWMWFNLLRYGSFFGHGYTTEPDATFGFSTPLLVGLFGLLLSSGKSVFLYAPALFASLAGFSVLARRRRSEMFLIAATSACLLLIAAKWWNWSGDWAWGPRLVVPLLPALFIPVIQAAEMGRPWRWAIGILGAIGFLIQIPGILIHEGEYLMIMVKLYEKTFPAGLPGAWTYDEQLLAHFVPYFSPIAGHFWLLVCYIAGGRAFDAPWQSLGVRSWDIQYNPALSDLNFWFDGSAASFGAAAALLVMAAALALVVRRACANISAGGTLDSGGRIIGK